LRVVLVVSQYVPSERLLRSARGVLVGGGTLGVLAVVVLGFLTLGVGVWFLGEVLGAAATLGGGAVAASASGTLGAVRSGSGNCAAVGVAGDRMSQSWATVALVEFPLKRKGTANFDGRGESLFGGGFRHFAFCWKKFDCVGDSVASCGGDKDGVVAVVGHGGALQTLATEIRAACIFGKMWAVLAALGRLASWSWQVWVACIWDVSGRPTMMPLFVATISLTGQLGGRK
jgi:hypothetical protein